MRFESIPFGQLYAIPSRNGVAPPKASRGSGVPMVNMGDLFANPRLAGQEMERVPLSQREMERCLLKVGDLLFARRSLKWNGAGACSLFLAASEPTTFESSLIRVRLNAAEADSAYYFYFFRSGPGRRLMETIIEQTAVAGIKSSELTKLTVPAPSLGEQRRIALVLGALDDKIDRSRRLCALLEETAEALFRARFVDFVGERRFVETALGRTPRGWVVAPIGDVLQIVGGSTPSTKERRYWDGGRHCWATPKDLAGARSPVLLDTTRRITDEGLSRISSRLLPKRTVLLSSRAPVGYTALSFVPVAVNQGFIAIPPSGTVPSEYVLFWLRQNMDRIKAHAGGTTFAEISKRAFRPLLMLVPPAAALAEFEDAARPMFALIAMQDQEIQTLSDVRDVLLPKLISGEIRVPDTADPNEVIGPAAEEVAA
jgi:type I restriction enzyme S subunit